MLCLGGGLVGEAARRFLAETSTGAPEPEHAPGPQGPANVVLAAGPRLEIFQDLVDHDRLYYLTQKPPTAPDVVSILDSAIEYQRRRQAAVPGEDDDERDLAVHRILRLTGLRRDLLSPDAVKQNAIAAIGLDDFGSDDFEEGLAVF